MSAHLCTRLDPKNCYRCELQLDEIAAARADALREADEAWAKYRAERLAQGYSPTSMRRRDFIAGFMASEEA